MFVEVLLKKSDKIYIPEGTMVKLIKQSQNIILYLLVVFKLEELCVNR